MIKQIRSRHGLYYNILFYLPQRGKVLILSPKLSSWFSEIFKLYELTSCIYKLLTHFSIIYSNTVITKQRIEKLRSITEV
jgi:hypothetical protein